MSSFIDCPSFKTKSMHFITISQAHVLDNTFSIILHLNITVQSMVLIIIDNYRKYRYIKKVTLLTKNVKF